jgi:hypothetical protein
MKTPKTKSAKQAKAAKVMGEYKAGTLHAGRNPKGPKKAPLARSRKQAIAIAMSEAGIKKRK